MSQTVEVRFKGTRKAYFVWEDEADPIRLKVIDEIIKEPVGGAHVDPDATGEALREALIRHVTELRKIRPEKLVRRRAEKYAAMGAFTEA